MNINGAQQINMGSGLRIFSIIAYLLIFLQGSMIALPFGCMLVTGIFSSGPLMTILLLSADIALIVLFFIAISNRTKWTTLIETICFAALLSPLLKIFMSFTFHWFSNFLFLFPAACFIVFYPLSVFMADREYSK
jgi:hypothetical protein